MKRILLTAVFLITTSAFAAETTKQPDSASKKVEATKNPSELTVGVKGMVCAFCAQGIEKKFKAQEEVESVQVSLENKFVKLKFKEGKRLSNEKIGALLKDAGYDADFGG